MASSISNPTRWSAVLLCLYMMVPGVTHAQPSTGSVAGRVLDAATSRGVPGVLLYVLDADSAVVSESISGSTGRFRIRGLPVGTLTVLAHIRGYRTLRRDMTVQSSAQHLRLTLDPVRRIPVDAVRRAAPIPTQKLFWICHFGLRERPVAVFAADALGGVYPGLRSGAFGFFPVGQSPSARVGP